MNAGDMSQISRIAEKQSICRDECVDLLRSSPLARVVLSIKCLPVALPARIERVTGLGVLLTTTDAAVLAAAQRHDVVCLQSDGFEPDGRTWSVMVSGLASVLGVRGAARRRCNEMNWSSARFVFVPLMVVVGQRG